jgi:hypothetical protein
MGSSSSSSYSMLLLLLRLNIEARTIERREIKITERNENGRERDRVFGIIQAAQNDNGKNCSPSPAAAAAKLVRSSSSL